MGAGHEREMLYCSVKYDLLFYRPGNICWVTILNHEYRAEQYENLSYFNHNDIMVKTTEGEALLPSLG